MSKKTFLPVSTSPDFAAIHPAASHWLDTVANVRIHGETVIIEGKSYRMKNQIDV